MSEISYRKHRITSARISECRALLLYYLKRRKKLDLTKLPRKLKPYSDVIHIAVRLLSEEGLIEFPG